jgi:hypothetical protein
MVREMIGTLVFALAVASVATAADGAVEGFGKETLSVFASDPGSEVPKEVFVFSATTQVQLNAKIENVECGSVEEVTFKVSDRTFALSRGEVEEKRAQQYYVTKLPHFIPQKTGKYEVTGSAKIRKGDATRDLTAKATFYLITVEFIGLFRCVLSITGPEKTSVADRTCFCYTASNITNVGRAYIGFEARIVPPIERRLAIQAIGNGVTVTSTAVDDSHDAQKRVSMLFGLKKDKTHGGLDFAAALENNKDPYGYDPSTGLFRTWLAFERLPQETAILGLRPQSLPA